MSAGAIVGLPESPLRRVVLRNVKISARTRLTIGYAVVWSDGVVVKATEGQAIVKAAGANIVLH